MQVDDELKLAREDYQSEETSRASLLGTAQFHLTLATLLGGGSLAIVKATAIVKFPRLDIIVIFFVFALFWISLANSAIQIARALKTKTMGSVPPLNTFTQWNLTRKTELVSTSQFTDSEAQDIADRETLDAMKAAYLNAAQLNRTVNDERQACLTESMGHLINSALYLALMGGVYLVHYSIEVAHEQNQRQHVESIDPKPKDSTAARDTTAINGASSTRSG